MPGGTYEEDAPSIRGDVFLDRVLGWLCFACGLPVLGVALFRLSDLPEGIPFGVQVAKVCLIVFALAGIVAITTSRKNGFRLAILLYAIRILGGIALYPWSGGARFAGTEFLWDAVVIGYCFIRLRSFRENLADKT
jgi:hypothetical protein